MEQLSFTNELCPFCLARRTKIPPPGSRLVFLNNSAIGARGVVADYQEPARNDRFYVKLDHENSNTLCIVDKYRDLYVEEQLLTIPEWMPPLSIQDCELIHRCVQNFVLFMEGSHSRSAIQNAMYGIVECSWSNRLPITGNETWAILQAHGIDNRLRKDAIAFFEFGVGLLTNVKGRRAVMRKRMPAMSKVRYITKAKHDLWERITGRNNEGFLPGHVRVQPET